MREWVTSAERESLNTGKRWPLYLPHFLTHPLHLCDTHSAKRAPSQSLLDNLWTCLTLTHTLNHTLMANDWTAADRLPFILFSHRGGIQAPTHSPTHANPRLAWLRSVQRDSVKSVHLRLTGQVLFHLPVSSYHEQQRGVAIPSTKTHTRTDRHTRRRTARIVASTASEQQSHFSPVSEARKLWGMGVYSRTFRWAGTESFFTETWVGYFFCQDWITCFLFSFL